MWTHGGMLRRLEKTFLRRPATGSEQFDSLDGLRGIAVLLVVSSHMANGGYLLAPRLDLRGAGRHGVYLFFALSAFLLTYNLLATPRARLRDARVWIVYAMRRVLRIYPLYVVVLVATYAAHLMGLRNVVPLSASELARHLLLLEGKDLYWAVPVEFTYYLLLPLVVWTLVFVLRGRSVPVFAAGWLALTTAFLAFPGRVSPATRDSFAPYLPIFLLGSLAAFVHWRLSHSGRARSRRARTSFEVLALLALCGAVLLLPAVFCDITGRPRGRSHFVGDRVALGLLFATFLLAHLHGLGGVRRVLSWKLLRVVGVISFSVYLWHLPIYLSLGQSGWLPGYAGNCLVFCVAVALPAASYVVVERPFLRLGVRTATRIIAAARRAPPSPLLAGIESDREDRSAGAAGPPPS